MFIKNILTLKDTRRKLRTNLTPEERKLWQVLRNKQIKGYRFLRQFGIQNYILDFFCPKLNLAIEVDGGQHNSSEEIKNDKIRTELLNLNGITVIRFWNNDINSNLEGVYAKINNVIEQIENNPS